MESSYDGTDSRQKKQKKRYLGCLTKQHLIMMSVAVGLVILVVAITVPAVILTKKTSSGMFLRILCPFIKIVYLTGKR